MDDFAGLIAETEASMRGKLSELKLPTDDESSPTKTHAVEAEIVSIDTVIFIGFLCPHIE